MGLSSSTSKTSTKPIYSKEIEGAAANVNSAYGSQAPKISAITDQIGSFVPGLAEKYTNGDPGVTAAQTYNTDVIGGKYLGAGNPYLEDMIAKSNSDVSNRLSASLGTRGLTGGSAFGDIISRAVADNGTSLRYKDYGAERDRMGSAAALAPSLSSASYLPLSIMQSIAQTQQMPIQAAAGAGNAVGGLLGQYTNGTTKSSPSIGQLIAQIAGNAASAYAMGG